MTSPSNRDKPLPHVPLNDLLSTVLYGGATATSDSVVEKQFSFLWRISVPTSSTDATPAAPPSGAYYMPLAAPALKSRIARHSLVDVVSVNVEPFLQSTDVELVFRIVPNEWADKHTPTRTFDQVCSMDHLTILQWRSNLQVPLQTKHEVAFPPDLIGTSLKHSMPGLWTPCLMVATSAAMQSELLVRVSIVVRCVGYGLENYPA